MATNLLLDKESDSNNIRKAIQELTQFVESQSSKSTDWISSKDVPNYLSVSRRTWQNYRDKKLIAFSQIGRKIWVKRSDLDAFIESGMIGTHGQTSKF